MVDLRSVLPGFLPSFPSQIWVSDVTFVTVFGDRKCDVSHFWEECDALAHENYFFKLVTFFVKSFPKNVTFGPRSVTPRPDVFYQRAVSLAMPSTITTTVNRQTQETSLPDR